MILGVNYTGGMVMRLKLYRVDLWSNGWGEVMGEHGIFLGSYVKAQVGDGASLCMDVHFFGYDPSGTFSVEGSVEDERVMSEIASWVGGLYNAVFVQIFTKMEFFLQGFGAHRGSLLRVGENGWELHVYCEGEGEERIFSSDMAMEQFIEKGVRGDDRRRGV